MASGKCSLRLRHLAARCLLLYSTQPGGRAREDRPAPPPVIPQKFQLISDPVLRRTILTDEYQKARHAELPIIFTLRNGPITSPTPVFLDGKTTPEASSPGRWLCDHPCLTGKTIINEVDEVEPIPCKFWVYIPRAQEYLGADTGRLLNSHKKLLSPLLCQQVDLALENRAGLLMDQQEKQYTKDWNRTGRPYHPIDRAIAEIARAHWCWHLWACGLALLDPQPVSTSNLCLQYTIQI